MRQKISNYIRNNQKKVLITCGFLVSIIAVSFIIANTFAALKPVRSVSISSEKVIYNKKDPGAWNIEKSAEWVSKGKARITFELDTVLKKNTENTDIILVLDRSGSMVGDKIAKVKADAKALVEEKLSSGDNRFALINFDTESELMLMLTNNKSELLSNIDKLTAIGTTNYYQALVNVDKVLQGYVKDRNRELVLLFLTDGFPNEDTPNEVGFYQYLKSQYPYMTVNAVQYEMGDTILEPIKKISDHQYIAHIDNLNNVLFEAADTPVSYDDFTIIDYIDDTYFTIDNVEKVEVSLGTAKLEYEGSTPKVTWSMPNSILKSGAKATMTIDVNLKDEYMGTEGMYPTNKKEEITSTIGDNPEEDIDTPKTPVLSEAYEVIYDGNAPAGCNISTVPASKKYAAYDTVKIDETPMTCGNYQFKGWEIITDNVTKVNDDYFIMPEEDVTLRATWSLLDIHKSMNGEISKVQTLYKIMADSSTKDNESSQYVASASGIDFAYCPMDNSGNSYNGLGVYELSSTSGNKRPIYYYRGNVNNNNVVYANTCWKAVRTTETGGVKLLYNGPTDANGHCTSTDNYSIGTSSFNEEHMSLADTGYMYGTIYQNNILGGTEGVLSPFPIETSYYYASAVTSRAYSSAEINPPGTYYKLVNEIQINNTPASTLIGKYMSWYSTAGVNVIDKPLYIAGIDGSGVAYGVQVEGGKTYPDYEFVVGNSITYNSNGTFTINNSRVITAIDWYNNFQNYNGYYTCGNKNTSCTNPRYIIDTYVTHYDYWPVGNFKYGQSFTYSGGQYTLTNTTQFYDWDNNKSQVNTHHYTCLNSTGKCDEVYYIYYNSDEHTDPKTGEKYPEGIFFVELANGKSIEDARREMETNTNDSKVKKVIDTWYETHIKGTQYETMLEDTVYCNSRDDNKSGAEQYTNHGWLSTIGNIKYPLYFSPYGRGYVTQKPSVTCENKNDAFTVNTTNGNGSLKYPIAMLNLDEADLAGRCSNTYIDITITDNTKTPYWLMAPISLEGLYTTGAAFANGMTYQLQTSSPISVRPVVSVKPGTRVGGGDGTSSNPYILEAD